MIISVISLIVSLVLGVITVVVMVRPNKHSLLMSAVVDENYSKVNVTVTNKGLRPINIKYFIIYYGQSQANIQVVFKDKVKSSIKINDGEIFNYSISRLSIIKSRIKLEIEQKYSHRLWLGVELSNGKTFYQLITINPSIIEKEYLQKAVDYISADLFLGFEQREPKVPLLLIGK